MIEIVSHCFRYWKSWSYQASALILFPPRCKVKLTLCYTEADERSAEFVPFFQDQFKAVDTVDFSPMHLEPSRLFRRAIGRNIAAKLTEADLVLFTDADYIFRDGCLDALVERFSRDYVLACPSVVRKCPHSEGDRLIEAASVPGVRDIPVDKFEIARLRVAIGGFQCVTGETARKFGYLDGHRRFQRPAIRWQRTFEDTRYRRAIKGGRGVPLDIPEVYRIRHSLYGREHENCEN